jgi:hypothetical protein
MLIWEQYKKSPWGPSTAVFFVLTLLLYLLQNSTGIPEQIAPLVPIFGVLALGSVLLWFGYAFTGVAAPKRPEQVKFSYFFVIASFAILVLPPLVNNQAIGSEAMGIVSGCVKGSDSPALNCAPDSDITGGKRVQNNQWLVNIGGALTKQGDCAGSEKECKLGSNQNRAYVTGGLVVPFPLLIIALFGAAISLSRRVPEIQKQSEGDYVGTTMQPVLTATEAREHLTFQVMQFISAPFIAITAHQIVRPSGEAASIALAFMAGFGSETILLLIRGVAEGIKPKIADTAQARRVGTVEGTISADGKPVSMEVTVRGTSLKEKSDSEGKYTIKGVPAGGQILSVLNGETFEIRDVTVKAGESTLCNFDIAAGAPSPASGPLREQLPGGASTAIEGVPTVNIRLAIDNPNLDPGTLRLTVDDRPVVIGDDHTGRIPMTPNVSHRVRADAMREGVAVSAEQIIIVSPDDNGKSFSFNLLQGRHVENFAGSDAQLTGAV